MNKEKQIYEIAKDLCNNGFCDLEEWNGCSLEVGEYCARCTSFAKKLYNYGYRRVSMTPEEFANHMREIRKEYYEKQDDEEAVHIHMDGLMLALLRELGYGEGIDIYVDTPMWYA